MILNGWQGACRQAASSTALWGGGGGGLRTLAVRLKVKAKAEPASTSTRGSGGAGDVIGLKGLLTVPDQQKEAQRSRG